MINLMLDSGAFSCWRRQQTLDLDAYLDFILEHESDVAVPVGLDVIPGKRGRPRTPKQVEDSAREGYGNAIYARARGVEVMPVFHQDEDFSWLRQMVADGFAWIGVSPRNDAGNKNKVAWLDQVFSYLCGDEGYPRVQVHGFGVATPALMLRYPWCAVDSSSWMILANTGNLIVPRCLDDGAWDFRRPTYLPVSSREIGVAAYAGRPGNHWETLGGLQREVLLMYIGELEHELDIDLSMESLASCYILRDVVNICTYLRMLEDSTLCRFRQRSSGFHTRLSTCGGSSAPLWQRTRLMFTVSTSPCRSWALNRCGVLDRLLTYFFLKNRPFDIAAYNRTGSIRIAKDVSKTDSKEGFLGSPVFGSGWTGKQGFGANTQQLLL